MYIIGDGKPNKNNKWWRKKKRILNKMHIICSFYFLLSLFTLIIDILIFKFPLFFSLLHAYWIYYIKYMIKKFFIVKSIN